jgi:[ribosomal protein S5]-alanine N-acetyltransferase
MVEVACSVDPAYRRRGYARAMLRELLRPRRRQTRCQHRPGNDQPRQRPYLATISGFGFTKIGERWDEEDGRELIFEVAPRTLPADLPGHCRRSPRPRPHR